jgi:hypothetical protein
LITSSVPRGGHLVGLVVLLVVLLSLTFVLVVNAIIRVRDRQIAGHGPSVALFTGWAQLYASDVREDPRLSGIANGRSLRFIEKNKRNYLPGQISFYRDRFTFRPGLFARWSGYRTDWVSLRDLSSWEFTRNAFNLPTLELHFKDGDKVFVVVRKEEEVSAVMQQLGRPYGPS